MKDIGGLRAADGRWPLVIDPSGKTSTFITYTGATVFHMTDLRDIDQLRLRRALLTGLLHGGCVLIDLGNFDFSTEVIEEPWSKVEKGLLKKLMDRSVLYSYLYPRRFRSLISKDIAAEFHEGSFMDENISKFVFGFVTSVRNPDFAFAKQFYTISVKNPDDEDDGG